MKPCTANQMLRPEGGPPTNKAVHTAPNVGGAPSRRMAPSRCPEKLRPGSGFPQKPQCRPLPMWERPCGEWRRPGARKASPRVGPPTNTAVHTAPNVGGAPSRRMAPSRCPKSFAPGRASYKKQQCTPFPMWEARPRGEWRHPGARKSFAPGRASHKEQQCVPSGLPEPHPCQSSTSDSKDALPPTAVVLVEVVRSLTKRSR